MFKNIIKKIIVGVLLIGPLVSFATISNILTYPESNLDNASTDFASGVFHGSANTGGDTVFGYFRYSTPSGHPPIFCNDLYGSDMKSTREHAINGIGINFTDTINDLQPDTTYSYCAVVSNSAYNPTEIKYGGVVTFHTNPCSVCAQTTITTTDATGITSTSANLKASYSSNIKAKTYFKYRTVTSMSSTGSHDYGAIIHTYGNWITPAESIQNHSNGAFGTLLFNLSGLSPAKEYQFAAVAEPNTGTTSNPVYGNPIEGGVLNFTTIASVILPNDGTTTDGGVPGDNTPWTYEPVGQLGPEAVPINGAGTYGGGTSTGGGYNGGTGTNTSNTITPTKTTTLTIGATATPPGDATVHATEGIETVFARQIVANKELAKTYGYQEGTDLQAFAWNLADSFARVFGYVSSTGKEIRVSQPDIAAYEIQIKNGKITVYEYYNSKIVNIRNLTSELKNADNYEYYFNKK